MTELGGWLCVVTKYSIDQTADLVDIWAMKEYGVNEFWSKLFSVIPAYVIGIFDYVLPLAHLKNAHQVLLNQEGEKLIVYDLARKRAKKVRKISSSPKNCKVLVYVNSLIGLGGDHGGNNGKKAGENGDKRKKEKQQLSGQKR
ncbi:hypothetical protein TorRG33x02_129470 [Trema orientale]|uniref:Uncharacterized protein n=1 Tax=Trema orientale TaxID=63057 RepID=A0A2P5F0R7_TREOI|nr:hypothetical protein TorRG33x02_129470 [Trema orientale]